MAGIGGSRRLDIRKRRDSLAEAISLLDAGEVNEEELRRKVMTMQAESLLKSVYFLESGVFERHIDRFLSRKEDAILRLKDGEDVPEESIRKLDVEFDKQAKLLQGYIKSIRKQRSHAKENAYKLLDALGIDAESLGVSEYVWGRLLPSVLKENYIPPFVALKEIVNINATNLLLYSRYGKDSTGGPKDDPKTGNFKDYVKKMCESEIMMIDAKIGMENARNDSKTLSEILQYAKEGRIDHEKLRRMVLARKLEQLKVLSDAFVENRSSVDWARLMVSPVNGRQIEPIEKLRILANEMIDLPKATGMIRLSESGLVKEAVAESLKRVGAIDAEKMTPLAKKEAEYFSKALSMLESSQITADELKGLVQSQKAEKLLSIASYFFDKTKSLQYLPPHWHEEVGKSYLDRKETFGKMLSNIQDVLLLLNEDDGRTHAALDYILDSVYKQKLRMSMQDRTEGGNGEIDEFRGRKEELARIERARDMITNTWTIREKSTKGFWRTHLGYSAVRRGVWQPESQTTFEELRNYIMGRKADEIRDIAECMSTRSSEIEKLLDVSGGYCSPLTDKYLDDMKALRDEKSKERLDAVLQDLADRVENDDEIAGEKAFSDDLKQLVSIEAEADKRKKLDTIVARMEEMSYGTIRSSFFKKLEGLKHQDEEFENAVHGLVTEFEEEYPEFIGDYLHTELKWMDSNSSSIMKYERGNRMLIDKIMAITDKYPKAGIDAIPEGRREILETLYSRIKLFELQDKKTVKGLLKKNVPEMNGLFLTEAEGAVKKEVSKLLAYEMTSETDLAYAAKKLCDYRAEFLNEKIAEIGRGIRPREEELLLKAVAYVTETPDYTSLVFKRADAQDSEKDVYEGIVDAVYGFAKDYLVQGIKIDLFAPETVSSAMQKHTPE